MTEHDLNTVRHLTEKFFNATISEAEMSLLDKYAESILSGKENGVMPDRMLLNDLSVVAALHQLNLRTLDNLSAQTPPGLEARLEKHISRISASSRKRKWRLAATYSGAAAAIAGIILTIGLPSRQPSFPDTNPLPASGQLAAVASTPTAEESHAIDPTTITVAAPGNASVRIQYKSIRKDKKKTTNVTTLNLKAETKTPLPEPLSLPPNMKIPDFTEPVAEIRPMLAAAIIDPSEIVMQPLTTLSQTVSNVYESVDIVSSAFAGIADAFEMVNSSLALLSPEEHASIPQQAN